jgi:hypothetical protein
MGSRFAVLKPRLSNRPALKQIETIRGSSFDECRKDPRFPTIHEKPGMLDYWRMTNKWPDYCEQVEGNITRCW